MTLDQIETFITVVEMGSFKAASEKLARSQPALSVSIKKLEDELGFLLFSREGYRPTLTEYGKQFYPRANSLIQNSHALQRFAKEISSDKETKISIAIDALCPLQKVFKPLRCLLEEEPSIDLDLSFEVLGGSLDKLSRGLVDFCIGPNVGFDQSHFFILPAMSVELIPVASEVLTKGMEPSQIELSKLKTWSQVIVRDSSQSTTTRSVGVLEGGRHITVGDLFVKKELLVAGLGWGRMPKHLIEDELRSGVLIDISSRSLVQEKLDIVMMSSSKKPQGPVAKRFWEMFSDSFFVE